MLLTRIRARARRGHAATRGWRIRMVVSMCAVTAVYCFAGGKVANGFIVVGAGAVALALHALTRRIWL